MKETLSIISFTRSGKILMIVTRKDNSGKDTILSNKCCESIGLMISDVINPVVKEIYHITETHIKEVIIALSGSGTEIMQNRGYLVRDSIDGIKESEVTELLNDMYRIRTAPGTKIINIAPLYYINNDDENIKNPVGLCWKRLEGKFQVFSGKKKLIDDITNKLTSQGINIKKFIPGNLTDAGPFLTLEEYETLSALALNN
jgi:cell division ATPase FtsA